MVLSQLGERMVWEKLLRAANRQSAPIRWALALLFLGLALAVRYVLRGSLVHEAFITFFPAIVGAAVLCGWRAACAIMLLSAAIAWAALIPPTFTWRLLSAEKPIAVFLYLAVSSFDIALVAALLSAVRANHRLVRQQETLFRELQHRVANTLQFIASMLVMARRQIRDGEDAASVLEDAAARIGASGQLHRRMHDTAQLERGVAPLLNDILADLFRDLPVQVTVDTAGVALPLSQVTPVVLLVTEAATNSLKHAFRLGQGRHFAVRLVADSQQVHLSIQDDGPGPASHLAHHPGLGMQIMQGLAAQLGGKLSVEACAGTRVSVGFRRV
jgi:two-component sensor histidine kinase